MDFGSPPGRRGRECAKRADTFERIRSLVSNASEQLEREIFVKNRHVRSKRVKALKKLHDLSRSQNVNSIVYDGRSMRMSVDLNFLSV